MNKCCRKTLINSLEKLIFNMSNSRFENVDIYIQALEYSLKMLKDEKP